MLVQECGAAVGHGRDELEGRGFDAGVHIQTESCTACESDTVGACSVRERDVVRYCTEQFSPSPPRHSQSFASGFLNAQTGKVRGSAVLGASCDRTMAGPSSGSEGGYTSPDAHGVQHEPETCHTVAETTFAEFALLFSRILAWKRSL